MQTMAARNALQQRLFKNICHLPRLVASTTGIVTLASTVLSAQVATEIDADRPHVGTGAHLVAPGEVQFEIGGLYQSTGERSEGQSPVLVRAGVTQWIELRAGSDGVLTAVDSQRAVHGIGDVQIGAKVRLLGDAAEPVLSIMPQVNIGVASVEKGLGSGSTDVTVTILTGRELTSRTHVEANYGVGNAGTTAGDRFVQHLATGAVTHATTPRLTTYVELAWWSRQDSGPSSVSFVDYGGIYALNPRVLVDVGAFNGVTSATPDYGVFGGVSFVVGHGSSGVSPWRRIVR